MKSLLSFTKKEFTEHLRSAKLFIIAGIFILFAVMNPLIAHFTPVLVEMLSESMAQSGTQLTVGDVTAMDSWLQFFKNLPIALIVFVIIESNIFTKEYQKGTLILALTKGLKRYKVIIAKTLVMLLLWSVCYWAQFGLTYAINEIVWDNSVIQNLGFAVFGYYLIGVMAICLLVFFSTIANANIMVLVGTGGVIFGSYLIGMLPKIDKFFPTKLLDTTNLIYGLADVSDYKYAVIITAVVCVASIVASIPLFNKRHI